MTDEETIVMSDDSLRQDAADAVAAGVDQSVDAAEQQVPSFDYSDDDVAPDDSDWGDDVDQVPQRVSAPASSASEPPGKRKKRKIDLKSRLSSVRGKARPSSTGRAATASFPPPPSGAVSAPRILGGITPKMSSPFAPPEPEVKPTAQQQTIKVEMGEEIFAERKKASKRTALFSLLVGTLMLVVGLGLGQLYAGFKASNKAIEGAGGLVTDVEEANKSVLALSDALTAAGEKLGQGDFPNDLADLLKKTNVPFSSDNFRGKSIGALPPEVLGALLRYTQEVDKLNKAKDALQNTVIAAKPAYEKELELRKKPVVNFSVVFSRVGSNIVAELAQHKKPFQEKEDWPASYQVVRLVGKKTEDAEVIRYVDNAKLFGDKPVALPIEERTIAGFTPSSEMSSLMRALRVVKQLTDGVQSPRADESTNGLVKDADALIKQLKKVAAAG